MFIQEREKKRHTILLYGEPNSGKTSFLECCKTIFDGYDDRETNSKFGIQIKHKETKAALVIGDEWD